jgi:hypothetical protein
LNIAFAGNSSQSPSVGAPALAELLDGGVEPGVVGGGVDPDPAALSPPVLPLVEPVPDVVVPLDGASAAGAPPPPQAHNTRPIASDSVASGTRVAW